ncbi:MAG: hypothetical protein ABSH09_22370 [Bryobacteraceae bacterium]
MGEVYQRGLRHLQLLHMRDDLVAPLGDLNTDSPHLGGLTAFGADVVKECNHKPRYVPRQERQDGPDDEASAHQ